MSFHKRRSFRSGAAAAVVLLLIAFMLTVANAHIGVSHSPFTTDAPDLRTVEVDGDAYDFCFDEEVIGPSPLDASLFQLIGYDSSSVAEGDDASLDDVPECVEVEFDGDMEGLEFTVGAADTNAVEDRDGNESVRASAALTGNELNDGNGRTLGPKLVDFEADENNDEITYTFDRAIGNCASVSKLASDFGYYTVDGENGGRTDGNTVTECDDGGDEVTVFFSGVGVDNVQSVLVHGGIVCVGQADLGGGHCNGFESEGDSTDSPDLIDAERTDDDEITYTFDEAANLNSNSEFFVQVEDSTPFGVARGGVCDQEDDDAIACEFAGIEDASDDEIVFAGVNVDAVSADAAPNESNTVGDAPVGELVVTPGSTDGPDLETCSVDGGLVTFNFDEPIDEPSVTDPNLYRVFDAAGSESPSNDLDTSPTSVEAEFGSDEMEDAVGCIVVGDGVHDSLQNDNPMASAGFPGVGPSPSASDGGDGGDGGDPTCNAGEICGTGGDDNLQGTPGDDVIVGGDGNDTINGGGGNDKIYGNEGQDTISGGDGNDEIVGGPDADKLNGNDGADKIIGDGGTAVDQSAELRAAQSEQGGPDTINGGGGDDTVIAGVSGDDVTGGGGNDKISTNAGADETHAGKGSDDIHGGGGADKVLGEGGNDDLAGEGGDDTLKGGEGVNNFDGGPGKDLCVLDNKKDDTKSCEKKKFNFKFNFFPYKLPL